MMVLKTPDWTRVKNTSTRMQSVEQFSKKKRTKRLVNLSELCVFYDYINTPKKENIYLV